MALEKVKSSADGKIVAFLAGLVLITRLPFRTTMLYNWDSVNFALALQQFDVTRHFPHPPGYFYYVNLARVMNVVLQDANTSFVAESVLFSVLAVVALYYLGKAMFDQTTGFVAALLLVFSVTFWSYGLVALPYVSLAFFSTTVALLAYQMIFERRNRLLPLSLAYTIGGGFRPDLLLFLGPLWLFSLRGQRSSRITVALLVVVGGFLLWFLPTAWLSGGIDKYLETFSAYTDVDVMHKYSVLHNGLAALLVNIRDTLSYLFYALYASAAVLAIGILAALKHIRAALAKWGKFVIGWTAPMALFYTWIHIGDPGYVFTVLPALMLIAARSVVAIASAVVSSFFRGAGGMRTAVAAVVAATVMGNVTVYLAHPRPLTLYGIRQADRSIAAKIDYIRGNYAPGSVLLISYDLYRHLIYYLPDYDSLWLDVYGKGTGEKALPAGVDRVILVDERLGGLAVGAEEVEQRYGRMYSLPVASGGKVVYSRAGVAVR